MKQITVGKNEDGQRLDRVLIRLLPNAGKSFIFKMLRKKNIVLNGKKAEGSERLVLGDEIKLFFSDETFEKMATGTLQSGLNAYKDQNQEMQCVKKDVKEGISHSVVSASADFKKMIVYEDEDVIILNKPKGVLSQKAVESDISLNEMLISYMLEKGEIDEEQLRTFRPSMCNRLDRNTSGLICGGKSLKGLRGLSDMFKSRELGKYYLCIVKGIVEKEEKIEGYLIKDEKTNKVYLAKENRTMSTLDRNVDKASLKSGGVGGGVYIATQYKPLKAGEGCTLLEVKLLTGKSHQIRAHLASIGHPIAGDMKYGDEKFNRKVQDLYKVRSQMLFAYRLVFPKDCGELEQLSSKEVMLEKPEEFFI